MIGGRRLGLFSAAFDMVNHQGILVKFGYVGVQFL